MIRLLFAGVVSALLCSSCGMKFGSYQYEFDNQTQYSIYVTVDEEYKLSTDENALEHTGQFYLYANTTQILYSVSSDGLDFQWTASYWSNNRYIYTVEGSKVTFKERAQ